MSFFKDKKILYSYEQLQNTGYIYEIYYFFNERKKYTYFLAFLKKNSYENVSFCFDKNFTRIGRRVGKEMNLYELIFKDSFKEIINKKDIYYNNITARKALEKIRKELE